MNKDKKIYLRFVEEEDKETIFNWRNDPVTIENSITGKVNYLEHKIWFANKIKDINTHLFIIINEFFEKVGIVFFNEKDNQAVISINLNPDFRGKGYGTASLLKAVSQYFDNFPIESIIAEIKENNNISLRLFKQIGFVEESKERNLLTLRLTKDEFNKIRNKTLEYKF